MTSINQYITIISHDLTGGDGVIIIIIIIESEVCRKVLPRFIRVIGLNRHNGGGEKAGMKDKKERGRRSRRKVLVDQTSL